MLLASCTSCALAPPAPAARLRRAAFPLTAALLLFGAMSVSTGADSAAPSTAISADGAAPSTAMTRADETRTVVDWRLDDVKTIGGQAVTIVGAPRVVQTPVGPALEGAAPSAPSALEFNGRTDGLFLDVNPLAGLERFTVEVLFEPAADGPPEQRFLHFEDPAGPKRALLETRMLPDGRWALDTFLKDGDAALTLLDRARTHAAGEWHAVALVYDGQEMAHYVDGVRELAGAVAFRPMAGGRTSIGVRQNQVYWFKGRIARVRVTAGALAPDQLIPRTPTGGGDGPMTRMEGAARDIVCRRARGRRERRPSAGRARPALPSLRRPRPDRRLRGRGRPRTQLRHRRDGHRGRRARTGPAVRPHAVAVVLGAGEHLRRARHAGLLLALARARGPHGVPDLPCRLRRPFELGHGLAAHRLQREAAASTRSSPMRAWRARACRTPCRPSPAPGVGAPGARVGRDARHPVLRRRADGGQPGRPGGASPRRSISSGRIRASSAPTRCRAPTTSSAAATSTRCASTTACSRTRTSPRSPGTRSRRSIPALTRRLDEPQWRDEWWHRYGWNRPGDAPPALEAPAVSVRKVEIHDAYDLKRWWWKGTDGIRETTWPGVYNRSRLPGRNDYFQLPDWDCYSLSGTVGPVRRCPTSRGTTSRSRARRSDRCRSCPRA